jgi:hypothetical protein
MADYYISNSGNDVTGDGSSGNPWATISKFDTASASGDTCYIVTSASTYLLPQLTTISKSYTIRSVSGTPTDVLLDGAASTTARWSNSAGITTIFQDVTIKNLSQINVSAFEAGANSWLLTFTNCIIRDTVWDPGNSRGGLTSAFVSTGCVFTFTNCVFYNNSLTDQGNKAQLLGTHQVSVTYVITNCTFYLVATGTNQFLFLLDTNAGTLTTTWKNNIIYNGGGNMTGIDGGTATYSNNCAYGTIASIPAGANNITSDPLFADAPNANFNLRPTSPCIDTGAII